MLPWLYRRTTKTDPISSPAHSEEQENKTAHPASHNYSHFTKHILNTLDHRVLRTIYPASREVPFNEGYLGGDPYWGRLWEIFKENGRGIDSIIEHAASCAEQNQAGLAWWRFGPTKLVTLITRPQDIEDLLKKNMQHLVMHDSTGQFKVFFGPQSIFSSPYQSANWNKLRPRFLHALFKESVLKNDIRSMQQIIDDHLKEINENKGGIVNNLEEFASSITMDMIGKLKLGLHTIQESSKQKISALISQTTIEIANPWQKLLCDYLPLYKYILPLYRYFSPSKLDLLLKAGYKVLREEYIEPNRENILSTTNWLNPEGAGSKLDLNTNETIYNITQFLVAGHETTAKLVLLSLLLLGDSQHQAILEKLRQEIAEHQCKPREWQDRSHFAHMPYLDAVVNEVLRLYPPIPDILFATTGDFALANGRIKADSAVIVSPRITQRSEAVWGSDAKQFKPERFMNTRYSEHQFFPFGFTPRQCVGQRFSIQEVKLILARTVSEFDLSHDLHHPFPFHQVFTMRVDLSSIQMRFTKRPQAEAEPFNAFRFPEVK